MQVSIDQALELLNTDPLRNLSIINYLSVNPDASLQRFGNSLLVRKEGVVYISCQHRQELNAIMANLDETDSFFASMEAWIFPIIKGNRETKWDICMQRYILPLHIPLPPPDHPVQSLGPEHAEMMARHWPSDDGNPSSADYIRVCLKNGPAAAVFVEGKPVSWAAVHEDGSLGFLYTKPEFRGQGYAQSVGINLIQQQRHQGKLSVACIEAGRKSLGLVFKLGFRRCGSSCWVEF